MYIILLLLQAISSILSGVLGFTPIELHGLRLVIHRKPKNITIANPGGMRISVDDAVFGGISDPRNVILLKLFGMINVAERGGTGVSGIYHVWKEEGWKTPVLEEQFNPDRTILTLTLSPQENGNVASYPL